MYLTELGTVNHKKVLNIPQNDGAGHKGSSNHKKVLNTLGTFNHKQFRSIPQKFWWYSTNYFGVDLS